MRSPTIISLGGSIVVPDGIDTAFVSAFRALIQERMTRGESFIVIVEAERCAEGIRPPLRSSALRERTA